MTQVVTVFCYTFKSICSKGNGWAKEKYEANLPADFKRPQNDS